MQSTWWRGHAARQVGEVALCATIAVVGLIGHAAARTHQAVQASPLSITMAIGASLAAAVLWWRREHLVLVAFAFTAIVITMSAVQKPGMYSLQFVIEVMVVCFTAGSWSRRVKLATATMAIGMMIGIATVAKSGTGLAAASAFSFSVVAFPAAAGYGSRLRRLYLEQVEARLAEAERDRDERAARARVDERTRIARELHDVVAHHVSLIGVQAGAARTSLDGPTDTTRSALEAIEESSRAAIGEMRQLLHVLRPLDRDDTDRLPQPGIDALPRLVDQWRAAGFTLDLRVIGMEHASPAMSSCCFRIVEESLTNVARHSQARSASVIVSGNDAAVTIETLDPGPGKQGPGQNERSGRSGPSGLSGLSGLSGRGHLGMSERAAVFGGTVTAGQTSDGGYLVRAYLPRGAA
jgi:signal transduction histidine kinase